METVNQLAAITNLAEIYRLKSQQVAVLETATSISYELFVAARADYMEVLLTRRDALDSQMELIEIKQRQFRAMVDMYRALGGGWRRDAATANADTDRPDIAGADPAPDAALPGR